MARRPVTFFDGGNIILGGDGSDIIEGRGGNDLIDGDAWLNVRISVRANIDGTGREIATFDSMDADGPVHARRHLQSGPAPHRPRDPVLLPRSGLRHRRVLGQPGRLHDRSTLVASRPGHRQRRTDGTDTLKHIERLQFADQTVVLGGLNHDAGRHLQHQGLDAEGERADRLDRRGHGRRQHQHRRSHHRTCRLFLAGRDWPAMGIFTDIIRFRRR